MSEVMNVGVMNVGQSVEVEEQLLTDIAHFTITDAQ